MKKILKISCASLLSLIVSACAPMPPRVPICSPINESKGLCIFTIGNEEYEVTGQDWTNLKNNSLVLPLESWQELKEYILKVCSRYENCPKKDIEKKIEILSK